MRAFCKHNFVQNEKTISWKIMLLGTKDYAFFKGKSS